MNGEQILLAVIVALVIVIIGCLGSILLDRWRSRRRTAEIIATARREVQL